MASSKHHRNRKRRCKAERAAAAWRAPWRQAFRDAKQR